MIKLAPTGVHYLAWGLGLLAALSPKLALAFPQLAPVFADVGTTAPLLGVWLGTSASSAFQSGQTAGLSSTAQDIETLVTSLVEKALAAKAAKS